MPSLESVVPNRQTVNVVYIVSNIFAVFDVPDYSLVIGTLARVINKLNAAKDYIRSESL